MKRLAWIPVALVLTSLAASAGETRHLKLDKRADFSVGRDLDNVVVTSTGELRVGFGTDLRTLETETAVWSGAAFKGTLYFGTTQGRIFTVEGKQTRQVFDTKQPVVSAMAATRTHVYAATIPEGRIFRAGADGRWEEFRRLEPGYVWQLLGVKGHLYAACGRPATLIRVTGEKPKVMYTARAEHLLSVAHDGSNFIGGTAMPGRLIRFRPSASQVIRDFRNDEVRGLVAREDGIWAIVNRATTKPAEIISAARAPGGDTPQTGKNGNEKAPTTGATVWRFAPDRTESIATFPGMLANAVSGAADGVFIGMNNGGRVFRLRADGTYDLERKFVSEQVGGFVARGNRLSAVLLGDRAAVALLAGDRAVTGIYRSAVYDTAFVSNWGKVNVEATGEVTLRFRSGRIADPREGWSEWSAPVGKFPADVRCEPGRYIQFEVKLASDAELSKIDIAYRNVNQAPRIADVKVEELPVNVPPDTPVQRPGIGRKRIKLHSALKKVSWTSTDPDSDTLAFRVFVRRKGAQVWLPLLDGQPTAGVDAMWDTRSHPDGTYRVRVVASDEAMNLQGEALTAERLSDPVTVDNTRPVVSCTLKSLQVSGRARDASSRIIRFEYRVDGGEWTAVSSRDGIFDSKTEDVRFKIPRSGLSAGSHAVTVRAYDAERNVGLSVQYFRVK